MLALALATLVVHAEYAVDQAAPQGLFLHAAAGGGVVGGDVALALDAGVGVDTTPFAVHLGVPLTLRVFDLAPQVGAGQPAACRFVRCEEWLEAGAVSPGALTKIVEDVRVFRPGDWLYLKGGGLFVTLGHRALVDEYTNASDWDRRRSGLYAQSDLPWGRTEVNAFAGSFLEPQRLFGARLSTAPMASRADDDGGGFLGRLRLGFEAAGDAVAPAGAGAVDRNGDLVPGAASRPVGGVAVDATWPLLDDAGFLQIAPFVGGSAVTGLVDARGKPVAVGVGGAGGLDVSLDVAFVAFRAGASAFASAPGHRFGVFDTLYDVDRRSYARARGGFARRGAADLPSGGGVGFDVDVETVVMRVVKAGARGHFDPVPEATRAELFAEVDAGAVRVDARWQQRAFESPQTFVFGDRSFVVVDAAWQIFPPFSVFARWLHAPRFRDGVPRADDDVVIGASFDLVLAPS